MRIDDWRLGRREVLRISGAGLATLILAACGVSQRKPDKPQPTFPVPGLPEWPTTEAEILAKIETLQFVPGSRIRTTILPRKHQWEMRQLQRLEGANPEGDDSDWFSQTDIFAHSLDTLARAGVTGGRLSVFPFELTTDGVDIDWQPLETAIQMMADRGMTVDLCAGPLDYPYYPGVRLPKALQDELQATMEAKGINNITISLGEDKNFPELSAHIREYALNFFIQQLIRYGKKDELRIESIAIGNESNDSHAIEGIKINDQEAIMTISHDFMLELAMIAQSLTDKPIILNTNIHVTQPEQQYAEFGNIYNLLQKQLLFGLDVYPSREMLIKELAEAIPIYESMTDRSRLLFPDSTLVLTEFEAEPWLEGIETNGSWADTFMKYPDLVKTYYQNNFPSTLQTHLIPSDISNVGFWGGHSLPIFEAMKYDFPVKLWRKIADQMAKA